jgi:hypothetical protein
VGSEGAAARARVAVHGANLEALTGDDTFRIPLSRCSLESEGRRILARDQQSALVIWSDDEGFLQALERAQRGILRREVQRVRAAVRRRKLLKSLAATVTAVGVLSLTAVPALRWAVGGGIPAIADRIGESAIERLALPSGIASETEGALAVIAEQLRPATAPSTRAFRLLLADYSEAHSFGFPTGTVVVSAGLVCSAKDPETIAVVVARELAHLENRDVSQHVAQAVNWKTVFDLVRGDTSTLRARMLDFADRERCPGFPKEQQAAAEQRARTILTATAAVRLAGVQTNVDWSKVRAEACELIGR